MKDNSEKLTLRQRYDKLSKKNKSQLREAFISKLDLGYSTFYRKFQNNSFKTFETEYLEDLLNRLEKATNTDINLKKLL